MIQTFEITKPVGLSEFKSSVISTSEGLFELTGKTNNFSFALSQNQKTIMSFTADEKFVKSFGKDIPVKCSSWIDFPLELKINGHHYSHDFEMMKIFEYSMLHSVLKNGERIGRITEKINGRFLFWSTGGKLTFELRDETDFLEPLFYCIAWWWFGYYTNTNS